MWGRGCTINGSIDDSKFSDPIPWIGIYVAAASAACALAMAIDAFHGFRYRKLWFPCKFFSLNATTLTLITVATKLSVDLNTSMPRRQDQLAKLSSAVFICTVIGNFMPSLGTMQTNELLMNLMALGIFVVTVIVNICIQLATGVIYVFWVEHAAVMFLMVVLLVILLSTSVTIPVAKSYLDAKYTKKHKMATIECESKAFTSITEKLRDDLARFWMMAHTCCPQFVTGRLATCTGSGAVCVLSTLILLEAMLRCYLMPWSFKFCNGESDYKWSSTLILITQVVSIAIGSIAPGSRWLLIINFRCPKKVTKVNNLDFKTESYWVIRLNQWKESPLVLEIRSRHCRKLVNGMMNKVLDFCIWVQIAIVVLCKIVRLISIYFMVQLKRVGRCCNKWIRLLKCKIASSSPKTEPESPGIPETNVRHYVLHLEGEERLIDVMAESNCDAAGHFIRMGKKKQPRHLIHLLEKIAPSREYQGVRTFDSEQVPSLISGEPFNCWALPVVTLTSISLSLSQIDNGLVKELIRSINEALIFIRLVEQNLDLKGDLTNIRMAADIVWVGVDLHYKWLDVDLQMLAFHKTSPKEVLEELSSIAKHKVTEFTTEDVYVCMRETPSKWPVKVFAANCMYRICETLLMSVDSRTTNQIVFERLCALISDIVGACLTNLQNVISMKCHQSAIEEREASVRFAILLLGKTEKILRILDQRPLPNLRPDQLAYIDEWRGLNKRKNHLLSDSSTINGDSTPANSSDLYLTIE